MIVRRLSQVWLSDISYIRIHTGFVYLAAVLDACSRRVVGYAVSTNLDALLTSEALRMAIGSRHSGCGTIHHFDQGVQYASSEYVEELTGYGFVISMARSGNPYDNAPMESLFKTLKYEVNQCECEDFRDVVTRLPYFIEEIYNRKRLHSSLGSRPPDEYESLVLGQTHAKLPCQTFLTENVQPYGYTPWSSHRSPYSCRV